MAIEFKCPNCETSLSADEKLIGNKGTCPVCKIEITVPTQDSKDKGNKAEKGK
jgi:hypothetical protein